MPVIFSTPYREPPPPAIDGWIKALGDTNSELGQGLGIDTSGNVYITGQTSSTPGVSIDFFLAKYNSAGTLQWQNAMGPAGSHDKGRKVVFDTSGNAYVPGFLDSGGSGNADALLTKWDSAGNNLWQRALGELQYDEAWDAAAFSDDIYIIGKTNNAGTGGDILLAKYDTSGNVTWQRNMGGSGNDTGYAIATDASGNVFIGGVTNSEGAGGQDMLTAKFNSSGTLQWQRMLGGTGNESVQGIATDASGNVFVSGNSTSTGLGSTDAVIAKYNTSGALQWQRVIGNSSNNTTSSVATDASGNVYLVGKTSGAGAGDDDIMIAKWNTSGTLQWQRALGGADSEAGFGIAIDPSGYMVIQGYGRTVSVGSDHDFLTAKLPDDGSETGIYGDITYQSISLTEQAAGLTGGTPTLSVGTPSLINKTLSKTVFTTTFTETVIAS